MDIGLERLIKKIREEKVALFIGSGFSLKAGAPSVSSIINAIIKSVSSTFLDSIPNKDRTLRKISQAFIDECNSRNDLINILRSIFTFEPKDTSDHKMLYNIPHFKEIFTTNYDTLIEDVYLEEANVVTSNVGRAYDGDKPATIYKIHGDISDMNNPDLIVISETDYSNFFKNDKHKLICQKLNETFLTKYILFVGYSLEDDNILEMIKNIRSYIGDNMKGMFLVAPDFDKNKIERLKKNKVAYINAYAEHVLGLILEELKKNVSIDYRRKLLSQETYDLFCLRNANFFTTTTHHEKENIIERINVKEGTQKKERITLEVSKDIAEGILGHKYNDCCTIKGTNISIPTYRIGAPSIKSFSLYVNGIKIMDKEDISSLTFTSPMDKKMFTFKMKAIGFLEKLVGYLHNEENNFSIDFQTPIGTLTWITQKGKEFNPHLKINRDINTYTNNYDAIKWITFLIKVSQGEKFSVNGKLCQSNEINQETINDFLKMESYYKKIRQIEEKTDIDFKTYDNYTEDNARKAIYLYSYLFKECLRVKMLKDDSFSFEIDTRERSISDYEKLKDGNKSFVYNEPLGEIKLNNQSFNIPIKTLIFEKCLIKSIKLLDEYHYKVTLQEQSSSYIVWCSDNGPRREGNKLFVG